MTAEPVLAPSRDDPVVRAASVVVGGPAGSRLAPARGFWRAATVLVMLAMAMLAGGVVEKQHCRMEGWYTPDQFWHACYTDIPLLYSTSGLGTPQRPDLVTAVTTQLDQPPLAGAAMWAVSGLVSGEASAPDRRFFDLSTVVLGLCLGVAVVAVSLAARRRAWDASHVALSPVLLTAALISYELLAVALVALALLALSRDRHLLAGCLAGLAATARPNAFLLAVAVLLVCARRREFARAALAIAGAAAVAIGVRVVLLSGGTGRLRESWDAWYAARPGYGSLWLVPQLLGESKPRRARWWYTGDGLSAASSSQLALLGLAGLLVLALVWVLSRRPVTVPQLALFLTAGSLLVAKDLAPQVSVVLLPLLALSGLRWREHLVWGLTEVLYFVMVWLYLTDDSNRGLPAGFYIAFLLLRLFGLGYLVWRVWRLTGRAPSAAVTDPDPAVDGRRAGHGLLGDGPDVGLAPDRDFGTSAAPATL